MFFFCRTKSKPWLQDKAHALSSCCTGATCLKTEISLAEKGHPSSKISVTSNPFPCGRDLAKRDQGSETSLHTATAVPTAFLRLFLPRRKRCARACRAGAPPGRAGERARPRSRPPPAGTEPAPHRSYRECRAGSPCSCQVPFRAPSPAAYAMLAAARPAPAARPRARHGARTAP